MFDCLHDMGHPVGAARHVRGTLAPGGTWMIVEPNAGEALIRDVVTAGGPTHFRRAAETRFNLVFEARL